MKTTDRPVITFEYLNHNGVRSQRALAFESITFEFRPGFGYQPGWFINGQCLDKKLRRSFALDRIQFDAVMLSQLPSSVYTLFRL